MSLNRESKIKSERAKTNAAFVALDCIPASERTPEQNKARTALAQKLDRINTFLSCLSF